MPEPGRAPLTTLAASTTKDASMQSYLTIRWLADRAYRADAYALYAYFRWLDDTVDEDLDSTDQRLAFVSRQRDLVAQATAGTPPVDLSPEETLLVGLVRRSSVGSGREVRSEMSDVRSDGLLLSLHAMLDVMDFDARRRGRPVAQHELDGYTGDLAVAVTEALHHCIGHGTGSPHDETRYVAVTGAHVAHMLRDLAEDLASGYLNLPLELVADQQLSFEDLHAPAMRAWVRDRVELARSCFATGRRYLARVENGRCRVAGHAYIARFEWVLDTIEHDGYRVRACYPERGTLRGGLTIAADGARSAWAAGGGGARPVGRVARRETAR